MQSETGFPSSHQLKSYVASKSRLKLAARAVLSADAGLLVFAYEHHKTPVPVIVHVFKTREPSYTIGVTVKQNALEIRQKSCKSVHVF